MAEKHLANQGKSAHPEKGKRGPRPQHQLSATFVRTVSKKDTYADGGGLFLQVGIGGAAKSWIFIYRRVRFSGDDSHGRFIKALEHEHRAIPQERGDRTVKLFKIASAIIEEHKRDYAAHEADYKSGERKKSELAQAAEAYVKDRRRGYVGLGPANTVTLAKAREKAAECRAMLAEKPPRDPLDVFEALKRQKAKEHIKTKNFYEMTESYLDARRSDPDKPMHISTHGGLMYTLKKYLPSLHEMPPAEIKAKDIFDIIQPLRQKGRRSTANKSRKLVEWVIEWARANDAFPKTEINPAALGRGSPLSVLLHTESTDPKPYSKRHPALHFSKIPELFAKLEAIERRTDFVIAEAARATGKAKGTLYNNIRSGRLKAYKPDRPFSSQSMDHWWVKPADLFKVYPQVAEVIPGLPSVALYALQYQILTAARPGESLGMRWEEWEETGGIWHLPWQRTKMGGRTRQDHYVPLNKYAIAILDALLAQQRRDGIPTEFVFGSYWTANLTSAKIGTPPVLETIRSLLEKNVDKVDVDKTLHGMRTAFSSWATKLGYQEKDIERGLSHIKGYGSTQVARIYNRDAFGPDDHPLRELFDAWGNYCLTGELPEGRVLREPAEVISLAPQHRSMK